MISNAEPLGMHNSITCVPGIEVGCAEDPVGLTGCTVILAKEGAVPGVDVRGSAPGTRETDLMRPARLVQKVHGIVLSGGSAFGLDAASGVMAFLEEQGIGFETGFGRVPIVGAAVIFDLGMGSSKARPDKEMGYLACKAASSGSVPEGNAGAGMGATVGKVYGPVFCMKGGQGTYCVEIGDGIRVGALAVVNALGDVVDPGTGRIIAGAYDFASGRFLDCSAAMRRLGVQGATNADFGRSNLAESPDQVPPESPGPISSTTLVVVATNAKLTKEETNKVAEMAHDGIARSIRPVHTMYDGDTVFALSTGYKEADVTAIGSVAADVVSMAIVRAVMKATRVGSVLAAGDIVDRRA